MTPEQIGAGLERALRSALAFAASRSAITAEQEKALLACLVREDVRPEKTDSGSALSPTEPSQGADGRQAPKPETAEPVADEDATRLMPYRLTEDQLIDFSWWVDRKYRETTFPPELAKHAYETAMFLFGKRAHPQQTDVVEALEKADAAIREMFRYYYGGETRGSYDGNPERAQLRKAGYATTKALAALKGSRP